MIKQGTVREIKKLAEGVKNNRTWELSKIVLDDGFECTTFNNIYAVGQKVSLAVQESTRKDRNGVDRKGWEIVPSKPKRESVVAQSGKFDEIMGALSEIAGQLVALDEKVSSIQDDLAKRP